MNTRLNKNKISLAYQSIVLCVKLLISNFVCMFYADKIVFGRTEMLENSTYRLRDCSSFFKHFYGNRKCHRILLFSNLCELNLF